MSEPSRRLDRRVLYMWWLIDGVSALVAVVALWILWVPVGNLPWWGGAAMAVTAVVLAAVVTPIRFRRWRYEIRQRDVLISRGALFRVLTLIPLDRIQFAETRQGPVDRLFRLNQLVLYTAAGRAGRIPGLDPSEAEALREELSKVVGRPTV
ncbi:MAG TPA: PH domain-containing protein [Actinomycetota bacterium]|nr:PH domain-containing protein [Actinomycetota bacterium]